MSGAEKRIVYGARCTWWDSIENAGKARMSNLPGCPKCGSVLFEMDTEYEWMNQIERYEKQGHPGYVSMVTWARGKCFPNPHALATAYEEYLKNSPPITGEST